MTARAHADLGHAPAAGLGLGEYEMGKTQPRKGGDSPPGMKGRSVSDPLSTLIPFHPALRTRQATELTLCTWHPPPNLAQRALSGPLGHTLQVSPSMHSGLFQGNRIPLSLICAVGVSQLPSQKVGSLGTGVLALIWAPAFPMALVRGWQWLPGVGAAVNGT